MRESQIESGKEPWAMVMATKGGCQTAISKGPEGWIASASGGRYNWDEYSDGPLTKFELWTRQLLQPEEADEVMRVVDRMYHDDPQYFPNKVTFLAF